MTSYDGGCFCCGKHKGAFASLLPNGASIHSSLAGTHFCNDCCVEMQKPAALKKMIAKWGNPRQWFEEIAKDCPWRSGAWECQGVYYMVLGSYANCSKEVCAFWHWRKHDNVS